MQLRRTPFQAIIMDSCFRSPPTCDYEHEVPDGTSKNCYIPVVFIFLTFDNIEALRIIASSKELQAVGRTVCNKLCPETDQFFCRTKSPCRSRRKTSYSVCRFHVDACISEVKNV